MPQYFNFKRLVERYSTDFVAKIPSEGGKYDDYGDYVKSDTKEVNLRGAIISHRESKIFRAEGTLTGQDKALYMLEPLDKSLCGAKVIHDDKTYSIGDMLENSEFTGVWKYTLKFVSAFNEVKK